MIPGMTNPSNLSRKTRAAEDIISIITVDFLTIVSNCATLHKTTF